MTTAKKPVAKKTAAKKVVAARPAGTYTYALGRRKRAIAQVRMWQEGKGEITVNGKPFDQFFTTYELREIVTDALKAVGRADDVTVAVDTIGGGMRGQAEATRLGISRVLIELNPEYRKTLKKLGYLRRDPREKERKHYGFKSARRASQWAKR